MFAQKRPIRVYLPIKRSRFGEILILWPISILYFYPEGMQKSNKCHSSFSLMDALCEGQAPSISSYLHLSRIYVVANISFMVRDCVVVLHNNIQIIETFYL